MPVKDKFPWDSFPFRLDLKDRVAWFQCQEHMDKEIARYNLRPRDYKKSVKRGHKIVKPVIKKDIVKPKKVDKKRTELLAPVMKFKTIDFAKQPNILAPQYK